MSGSALYLALEATLLQTPAQGIGRAGITGDSLQAIDRADVSLAFDHAMAEALQRVVLARKLAPRSFCQCVGCLLYTSPSPRDCS